jgi:hypothetical protein
MIVNLCQQGDFFQSIISPYSELNLRKEHRQQKDMKSLWITMIYLLFHQGCGEENGCM